VLSPVFRRVAALALSLSGVLATSSGTAIADAGDAINTSLRQAFSHDDNVFRVAGNATGAQSDRSSVTDIDISFVQRYGMQQVSFGAGVSAARYQRNTQLDSDNVSGTAVWSWRAGNRLDGELSWSHRETQSSLADLGTTIGNTATTTTTAWSGNYWFHSNWSAGATASGSRSENSLESLASSGASTRSLGLHLRFRPRSGNTVTLRHSESRTDYPDPTAPGGTGNDFHESQTGLDLAYATSGKTALNLQASRVSKRYRAGPSRNFDGWTGAARWSWEATGRLGFNLGAERSSSSPDDPLARSTVTDSLSCGLNWSITPRWTAGATLSTSARDVLGEGPAASDRTNQVGVSSSYSLPADVRLTLALNEERRQGGDAVRDYRSRRATLSLAWSF
jgi:hypothetical protein